jgi:transcriptional regulator GlxA family with amidase domain
VADLARQAGMSERTFVRRFKETMGIPPHQWIIRERIRRVRELLETSTVSMEEIARLGGFTTPALMRKHFSIQVGLTPLEYRRRFGGHHNGTTSPGARAGGWNSRPQSLAIS